MERQAVQVSRFSTNPIIRPHMDEYMDDNINGPSLIRVPDWILSPLGRYYLYFAHHDGRYIRLAFSDDLRGPWTTVPKGVLPLGQSYFAGHVASPDLHVDHNARQIRLYYHGSDTSTLEETEQFTRVAFSTDGVHFRAQEPRLGPAYFRVFQWKEYYYALTMPGVFYRSLSGFDSFIKGPTLFSSNMRHAAVTLDGSKLSVFYTNVGDCPENILFSTIDLESDWRHWSASPPLTVLEPKYDYEGGNLPKVSSVRGLASQPVCQLRDPAIFQEDGRTYLLYSVAGENGIAAAELIR